MGYWETLAQFVAAQMARTRLRERHQNNLRRKLALLQQMQGIGSSIHDPPLFPSGVPSASASAVIIDSTEAMAERILELAERRTVAEGEEADGNVVFAKPAPPKQEKEEEKEETGLEELSITLEPDVMVPDPYDSNLYSPKLMQQTDIEIDAVLYDAKDDQAKLEYQVAVFVNFWIL